MIDTCRGHQRMLFRHGPLQGRTCNTCLSLVDLQTSNPANPSTTHTWICTADPGPDRWLPTWPACGHHHAATPTRERPRPELTS